MDTERRGVPAGLEVVRAQLRHVYWIGGGSGSGKSTIARRLAAAHHPLRLYATDEVMEDHARRSTPERSPFLTRFMAMDMDERWVNQSPQAMLETFHWFRGEGFESSSKTSSASRGNPPSLPRASDCCPTS